MKAFLEFIGACMMGIVFATMFVYGIPAHAQTYQFSSANGYIQNTVQINGTSAQFVSPQGFITQTATIYPGQIVFSSPNGYITNVISAPSYSVPPSPPSPPSPRVLQ